MDHDAYKLNINGNSLTGFGRSLEKNIGKEMLQNYYELKLRILNYIFSLLLCAQIDL